MVRKTLNVTVSICLLCLSVIAFAGALEEGSAALERKDYKKAHSLLLPLAEQGDAFAQFNIAVMYAQGLGIERHDQKAVNWYQRAAEQGESDAQTNLAYMLEAGRGINKDYKKAMQWYLKAAAQMNAMAQHNIGSLYFNGYGVSKNDKKAVEWYLQAAEQGLPLAQNALGAMYVKGWGVEKDPNKGLEWILKAAKQGLPDAQKNAFLIYHNEAKQGNAGAMHNVAYMCLSGWAGKQDSNECIRWYEMAAKNGFAASSSALSQIYEKGLFGIKPDADKASYWKQQVKSK